MIYSKQNYILIGISLVLIVLGFVLMSGGGSTDPEVFNEEIFSTRRIVVAPILCTLGFLVMVVALIYKPKSRE